MALLLNSKVVNIWANQNADIGAISDPTPAVRVWSTASTGSGAANALQVDNIGASAALLVTQSVLTGGATIAPIEIAASLASQAFISFDGAFISTASINPTKSAFVIPVYHNSQKVWGYVEYGLFQSNLDQNLTISVKPYRKVEGNTEGSLCDPVETTRWLLRDQDEDIVHSAGNSLENMILLHQ